MIIPIKATLFVPKPNGVHELMDCNSGVDAALAECHGLSTSSSTYQTRAAVALCDVDVICFTRSGLEFDASVSMVLGNGFSNHAPLHSICKK